MVELETAFFDGERSGCVITSRSNPCFYYPYEGQERCARGEYFHNCPFIRGITIHHHSLKHRGVQVDKRGKCSGYRSNSNTPDNKPSPARNMGNNLSQILPEVLDIK